MRSFQSSTWRNWGSGVHSPAIGGIIPNPLRKGSRTGKSWSRVVEVARQGIQITGGDRRRVRLGWRQGDIRIRSHDLRPCRERTIKAASALESPCPRRGHQAETRSRGIRDTVFLVLGFFIPDTVGTFGTAANRGRGFVVEGWWVAGTEPFDGVY
jgi:hypothetical protein